MNRENLKAQMQLFCKAMEAQGIQVFMVCEHPKTKTFHYEVSAPDEKIPSLVLKVLTAIGMAAKKVGIDDSILQQYLRGRTPREKLDAQIREIGLTPVSDIIR